MNLVTAGFAEREITPPLGMPLLGSMLPGAGVNDGLFARALVLTGDVTLVIIALDLIGLPLAMSDTIRTEVGARLGVPPSQVMVNCSHTHSAPYTIPWGSDWRACMASDWFKGLPGEVAACAAQAGAARTEATMRHGREKVRIGCNRRLPEDGRIVMRDNPNGPIVPWTDTLSFHSPRNGELLGVLFTAAAHPVIIHASSTLISADYPGYAVKAIRDQAGGAFAMFLQACGGDANGVTLRGGFAQAAETGGRLAEAALKAVHGGEPISRPALACAARKFTLPYRDPQPSQESELAKWQGDSPWDRTVAAALKELPAASQHEDLGCETQAFRISKELCLVGMTHEVFSEYQLWLERRAPFRHLMALGYTNGCESYLPLDKHFAEGGYESGQPPEAVSALFYRPRLPLRPGVEAKLKMNLESALKEFNQ